MYTVGQGYAGLSESYSVRIRGLDKLKRREGAGFVDMGFPADAVNVVTADAYSAPYGRHFMPGRGFSNQFVYFNAFKIPVAPTYAGAPAWSNIKKTFNNATQSFPTAVNRTIYPFVSRPFTLPQTGTFDILHEPLDETDPNTFIRIDIYSEIDRNPLVPASRSLTPTSVPVQTLYVRWPGPDNDIRGPLTLPVPTSTTTFESRVKSGTERGSGPGRAMLIAGDTIRGLEIGGPQVKGDLRLSAALSTPDANGVAVPSTWITKRGQPKPGSTLPNPWDNQQILAVHGMRTSHSEWYTSSYP
jgi:hypothetical protein